MALSNVEVDVEPIVIGQRITVGWRGQPPFITRRTPKEIAEAEAKADDTADLRDPEPDGVRAAIPSSWLNPTTI